MFLNFRTLKSQTTGIYWNGIVNTKTGEIVARSSKPASHPYEKQLNVRNKVNQFPCTDEDFIVLSARKVLKEAKAK
jgi:hypothetical protein